MIDTATNTVVTAIPVGSGPFTFGQFIGPGEQSCVEPPAGLVSCWPGEGNANDVIGGHDGTLAGGVTFVPGRVGQAFKFDTSPNSYIALPNSPDFMPASNQVTISAWIKPDFAVANGADIIFSKRDGCGYNRSYILAVSKAGAIPLGYPLGTIVWSASVAGDAVRPSTTVPNDGQFHHIAGTYDGTVMRVYMDGVLIGEKPHTGPIPVTSDPPFIGLQSGCSGWLSAAVIDEIEFRNRALSASEIQAVFNAGCAGMCEGPAETTPPTTTDNAPSAWQKADFTVTLTCTDNDGGSGCKETKYRVDDGAWQTGNSITISTEGDHLIEYYSIDNVGNQESVKSTHAKLDKTAPTISATVNPLPNAAGWNNTDVTVTWNWSDTGGSGIDAANCTASSASTGEGTIALNASCNDRAGNTGIASYIVKVDKTVPSVSYSGNAGTYTIDQTVSITCSASDILSDVASNTCANINGPAYTFALGTNTFSASATDWAGNTGSGSTSFTVVVTYESLRSLTSQFVGQRGILNSLEAKLNAAEAAAARGNANAKQGAITAYINEVQAQSGKALTADQAAILIRLAQAF